MIARRILAKPAKFAHTGGRCRAYSVFEQNGGFFQEAPNADLRFGDDIHGTDFQGADGRFRSGACEFGTDHDRHRTLGHESFEKSQAIHSRHFQVEKNEVGRNFFHFVHGDEGISRHVDTESTLLGKHGNQDLADDSGIVHNEDVQNPGVTRRAGGESLCEIVVLIGAHVSSYS